MLGANVIKTFIFIIDAVTKKLMYLALDTFFRLVQHLRVRLEPT
jgi:hypothetical protein